MTLLCYFLETEPFQSSPNNGGCLEGTGYAVSLASAYNTTMIAACAGTGASDNAAAHYFGSSILKPTRGMVVMYFGFLASSPSLLRMDFTTVRMGRMSPEPRLPQTLCNS